MAHLPARRDDLPDRPLPVPHRGRAARRSRPAREVAHLEPPLSSIALIVAHVALLLAACTASIPPVASASPSSNTIALGGVVRVALSSDIQSLDPWTATDD